MPRKLHSSTLETRTARERLTKQKKPYWITIAPGISLGYRRSVGPGAWNVRAADGKGKNWVRGFGIADDQESANNSTVFDFSQAQDKAKALARGGAGDGGRPSTVDDALIYYAGDLEVRGANEGNAKQPRKHLTPALLARQVGMLTVKELRAWRNALHKAGVKASTINRICKPLKAALTLAASHDDRITNDKAWRIGLSALPEDDDTESNLLLIDEKEPLLHAVVALSYDDAILKPYSIDGETFGVYVEVHAATGARSGQIAQLNVSDLKMNPPKLMMPSSLKGKNRKARTRKSVPIAPSLARKLKALCVGRPASAPLLLLDGVRWENAGQHRRPFAAVAKAAGLPEGATIYCLRHTSITRALMANTNIRLVASSHDTSVAMIEKTYSKHITEIGDEQMRRSVYDSEAPVPESNVIRLAS